LINFELNTLQMEQLDTFYPGSYFLIFNRANNNEDLFTQKRNYLYFLEKFDLYLNPVLEVMSYCLLQKSFVFLVRIRSANTAFFIEQNSNQLSFHNIVSLQFRHLFTTYSKAFNKQEQRFGSLFQRPYKRREIINFELLKRTVFNIHKLPEKNKKLIHYTKYDWSSYRTIVRNSETKLLRAEVLEIFGGKNLFIDIHENRAYPAKPDRSQDLSG